MSDKIVILKILSAHPERLEILQDSLVKLPEESEQRLRELMSKKDGKKYTATQVVAMVNGITGTYWAVARLR